MKRLVGLLLVLVSCNLFAQSDSALNFNAVVIVDSASKSQLFDRARLWVNDNFRSGKDVIQVIDKYQGVITGKGFFIRSSNDDRMEFSFKIFVKDGKYKYQFYDFNDLGADSFNGLGILTSTKVISTSDRKTQDKWESAKSGAEYYATQLISSLQEKMSVHSESSDF